MLRIEVLSDRPDQLDEGPLWDAREQRLYWIDSYGPLIHCCDAAGRDRRSWRVPAPIGSMALREKGGAILSLRDGFHAFDFGSGDAQLIAETQPGELRPRMNDGKVDRHGRFVAGSMDFEENEPVGKLFRLDSDLSVHQLNGGIICSNGPCWSPDGRILYFADTGRRVVWAYDYDTATGGVRSRRVFANFESLRGLPDGATVHTEGYVWSVEVYSGRLDPVRSERRHRPHRRPACSVHHQPDLRRPRARHRLRHIHGAANTTGSVRPASCSRFMGLACAASRSRASGVSRE